MELKSNLINFNENYVILFILIMFFILFSYILLREKIGRDPSFNEIIGLSDGSLQGDYKRHYDNKRRRKFFQ